MPAPSTIGRLRVERPLGAGGFATVWLAHDPDLDAPVAVKLLADNWSQDADVRRRFTDEARLLRRVDSDHLVRVYDIGELPDGRPYFVMTYADRGSLADRLAALPPPWPAADVLRIVDAIAAGLAVLHEHGIVHRDLKPRNVLLRAAPDGERVVLGDLGIAKDLQWASGITMPAGSDGYMAPEQRGYSAEIGPATDVHALAMTAAELLGLAPPWPGTPLGDVLARATAPDPAVRTASAPQFAAGLRAAAPGPDAPTAMGRPIAATALGGPPAGAGTRHRRAVAAAVAAAGAVVVGVAGWVHLTSGDTVTPPGGHASVQVPGGWGAPSPVAFPGGDDPGAGARAGRDGRSVAVAWTAATMAPADVLAPVVPAGCTRGDVQDARVGSWSGVTVRYAACPDGATVDEAVIAGPAGHPWTVWVEVRSRGGQPSLTDVLSSLDVQP